MMAYEMLSCSGEREYNEDSVRGAVNDGQACFVLADGLGGHGGGDLASSMSADCVMEIFKREGLTDEFLEKCFQECHKRLTAYQRELHRELEMKTTLVILIIDHGRARWGHIGDSRLYCFRKHKPLFRTLDHSVPQMLVLSGEIREREIRGHEDRNRLLRVLGVSEELPEPDITEWMTIENRSSFLLCTDGFWEWITEREMCRERRRAETLTDWLAGMERIVCANGIGKHMDNYSAIAITL